MTQTAHPRLANDITLLLLVEDNPADMGLVKAALAKAAQDSSFHTRLEHVECVADALSSLNADTFDAVLLDLGLPDSHGYDAISSIAAGAPQVPIVALTGMQGEPVALEALRRGAKEYVSKGEIQAPVLRRAISYAIERSKVETELATLARHDALTGLLNRAALFERLEDVIANASRNDTMCAVLHLDLDYFKDVNDTYGHAIGDALLQEFADRLRTCLRTTDVAARVGGDEFLVVAPNIRAPEGAAEVARKIFRAVESVTTVDGHEVHVRTSIGIALYPHDDCKAHELVANADAALYKAKKEGRGVFRFYDAEMDRSARLRRSLRQEMSSAIRDGHFFLNFQPIVDTVGGSLPGAEGLARWQHPERGQIQPTDFIPLAEDTGLVHELGAQLMTAACMQIGAWRKDGVGVAQLAINLSPAQFRAGQLRETIAAALDATGVPPAQLEFEITEDVLMRDLESISDQLHSLSNLGVSLAIDDFGTGYSSLSYVQRLPIQRLKIDRSFVKYLPNDQDTCVIVETIGSMAQKLGLQVTAEGVETAAQVKFLQSIGITQMQGYYFARPMAPVVFTEWCAARQNSTMPRQVSALVVDDDETLRDSISHVLATAGYTVEAVDSRAFETLSFDDKPPALFVCGLETHRIQGSELIRSVRTRCPNARIVALTHGRAMELYAMAMGADEIVCKPIDTTEFMSAVQGGPSKGLLH